MRSVTEFLSFTLLKGLQSKNALTAEGKTPEEISVQLGTDFKMEGDKLKYFINALEVAAQNEDKLMRIRVLGLAEGESVPAKAVQVEELVYLPEFSRPPLPVNKEKMDPKAKTKTKDRGDRPRTSPWGLTPEEKEKKAAAAKAAQAAKSNG